MIIKKINGVYLSKPDRLLLKITIENNKKEKDQFQFILTRRVVKSMMLIFAKILRGSSADSTAKKIREQKIEKQSLDLAHVFGPHLVTNFNLKKHSEKDLSFLLNLILGQDKKFQMTCSKKILDFLFNLFLKLQEKADWDLENTFKTTKTIQPKRTVNTTKRTLH